jgi:hypothetical protein
MGTAQTIFVEVLCGGATGNDVTANGPDRKRPLLKPEVTRSNVTGSDCSSMSGFFPRFFLTIVVVQNVAM